MPDSPTGPGRVPPVRRHDEHPTLEEAKSWLADPQPDAATESCGWPVVDRAFAWLRNRQRGVLSAGVALQLVVLAGLIAVNAAPLLTGDTVLLRVVPVDPRDLLRGDYVILGYEFSRVSLDEIEGLAPQRDDVYGRDGWEGRTVYVSLVPEADGRHWRADRFSVNRPESGKFIRGQFGRHGRLTFGIEQYYVQEGEGLKYERAVRNRRLSAEVAIDSDGRAKLRKLRIE